MKSTSLGIFTIILQSYVDMLGILKMCMKMFNAILGDLKGV